MAPATRTIQLFRIDPAITAFLGAVLGAIAGVIGAAFNIPMLGFVAGLGGILLVPLLTAFKGLLVGGAGAIIINAILPRVGGLKLEVDAPGGPA
ncbi:MAG TPA: hypothetical protein VM370_10210 [Candidatus Thermoplasmatota archaeon]|nr:hypothetical protein [Candidatus Thermoplasmatota archaeon]